MKAASYCRKCGNKFDYIMTYNRRKVCDDCNGILAPETVLLHNIRAQNQNIVLQFVKLFHEEEVWNPKKEAIIYIDSQWPHGESSHE